MKNEFGHGMKGGFHPYAVIACFLIALLMPSASWAGGSFVIEDMIPVLDQTPDIKAYILGTLDLDKSGYANRIGNSVNPRLGGKRLGPYCINAKPKGAKGNFTLKLCINTAYDFRDEKGRPCELGQAYSVTERFVSAEISPSAE